MGQTLGLAVTLAVAMTCGISAIAIAGPAIILPMLEAIVAISVAAFIVGRVTNIGRRFVLASVWLTITAAWVSAIFLDVTTPSAFYLANLQSCNLMTLLAGTFLAASFVLTGPCLRLGARLRHASAPSHEVRQPRTASETNPARQSRDTCPACGSRSGQPIWTAAASY